MTKKTILPLLLTLTVVLGTVTKAAEQGSNTNWNSLFDGKTLNGWIPRGGNCPFEVKNSNIVGTCIKGSPSTFLCTEKTYGDFELELEFQVDSPMNSGVQIRTQIAEKATVVTKPNGKKRTRKAGTIFGYQVEIDPTDRDWSGGIYDQSRRGWLAELTETQTKTRIYRDTGWNHLRILCQGNRIQTWLNGVPRADLRDDTDAKGVIGLQIHGAGRHTDRIGAQARFKNIRIRPLN